MAKSFEEKVSEKILKKYGMDPATMTTKQKMLNILAITSISKGAPDPQEFNQLLEDYIMAALKVKGAILKGIQESEEEEEASSTVEYTTVTAATYEADINTLKIEAHEKDFDKKYLEYVLEHQKIPKDAKIIFTKDKQN